MELRLAEIIGQGSFGIVHKAVGRGSVVAAKVISLPSADRDAVMKEIETIRYMLFLLFLCGYVVMLIF